ncbi:hypothetical protein NBRC10512_003286 [Rhodotorula toruloides]|uniref:RHTO0S24e01222g1_1 n=2 Tax=Rhodotorula toruloides TaxID=5286 RepID=A0A061BQ75_RHOTO|nr:SFP1, transcription regulator [Rhodotorula toruloides NP11]EMS19326.1 SFP1, transcription regulator [Rhodotorula toruloides NP11]CDR49225.1 RHTO0S24e01222g1_1 [Rhodotorula toruloides]
MPAPVQIARRESAFSPDAPLSPLLHPALSTSLSRSFGLNSPFSLAAMSTSLKDMSSSPSFSSMAMSLGRSFEERPKIEAQFFKNFTCCGLDLQDLHGLLEHFEECHVAFDDDESVEDGEMDLELDDAAESEGTISGPPSPRLQRFEIKKSGLSSFETPESPATQALHLDGGMELDMEMGDEAGDASSPSSVGSSSGNLSTTNGYNASFDPLQHGSAKKKGSPGAFNPPPQPTSIPPSIIDFGSRSRASSSNGTPGTDEPPNTGGDSLAFLPAGTVNPVQALGNGGFAPSLLFPPSTSSTTPAPGLAQQVKAEQHDIEIAHDIEPEEEEESDEEDEEEAEDSTDEEEEEAHRQRQHQASQQPARQGSIPSLSLSPMSPMSPQNLPALPPMPPLPVNHSPSPTPSSHSASSLSNKPPKPLKKTASTSAAAAAAALASLPPHPVINPHDPATISALANTTLKDPIQTAAAIAALGPNSLAALPTALHPLGQGVQISPSGRPYTPPSEKPFKCTVPGCDKAYKQQNGLKYHRLHGHCGANAVKEGTDPRAEGKPYVCHVASCGKRYKNMNGLRYHYQHSGAHGALGLQMLAQGCHPPPQFPPGHKRGTGGHHQLAQSFTASSSANSSRASSPASHHRFAGGVDAGGLAAALGRY